MSFGACRSQWDPVALSIKGNHPIWEHAHEYMETNQILDIIARRCETTKLHVAYVMV
jgi:hypothetical protein